MAATAASLSPILRRSPPLLVLLFLLLLPAFAAAQNITVGQSLPADASNSTAWLSPSGEFAFGFRPLDETNTTFLLCIWYADIPDRTIVWSANGDSPAPAGSTVQLSSTVGLVLANPQGSEIWRSGQLSGGVASASLTDSGNFVIRARNSSPLWETFGNPTDTILPSQTLGRGIILSSRRSESDFSKGRFRLILQGDGNLVLTTVNLPTEQVNGAYYAAGTNSATDPGTQLAFDELGFLSVVRTNGGSRFNLTESVPSSSNGGHYQRAILRFDGVLTQYYYPKSGESNRSWTHLWNQPENICTANTDIGSGTCGFNSICDLESDGRPSCRCPTGYSLMDPDDPYGNCRANYTQGCEEDNGGVRIEELYGFEEIENTDWPTSDYALLEPFTEEGCRNSCLHDCMCAAAIFRSENMCWKKKMPLSNGRLDGNLNGKALLKVRRGNVSRRTGGSGWPIAPEAGDVVKRKDREGLIVMGSVLFGISAFVNVALVIAICLGFHFVYRKKNSFAAVSRENDGAIEPNVRCFTYRELEEATDGFKEELGRGAFGIVYKGVIRDNGRVVAVKKLNSSVNNDTAKEFRTEVSVIGQIHHKNLVRLVGYCEEGEQRQMLVYEYLNGTLADYLFGEVKPSWSKRIHIALGVARGLLYLHEECSTQVIHCDIKPQNILLDDCQNARISDFGLAKLLQLNQSQTHTAIRGTRGYVAIEWFRNSPITVKVDVYSFGVLLLELICCRKGVDSNEGAGERAILTDWAFDCYAEGGIDDLVDHEMEALNDRERLEEFVMTALWCIQEEPSARPTMRQVWQMLEGVLEVPDPPCPSGFTVTTISKA
ncbi:unnamed protein product [Linum trigynum]|uniref:Receptor-like serine/threonine-protein kinase n=1 Tax=Linum trigynum TaxID=586398 RepID=A0AAV2F0V6_9ROSI